MLKHFRNRGAAPRRELDPAAPVYTEPGAVYRASLVREDNPLDSASFESGIRFRDAEVRDFDSDLRPEIVGVQLSRDGLQVARALIAKLDGSHSIAFERDGLYPASDKNPAKEHGFFKQLARHAESLGHQVRYLELRHARFTAVERDTIERRNEILKGLERPSAPAGEGNLITSLHRLNSEIDALHAHPPSNVRSRWRSLMMARKIAHHADEIDLVMLSPIQAISIAGLLGCQADQFLGDFGSRADLEKTLLSELRAQHTNARHLDQRRAFAAYTRKARHFASSLIPKRA